MGGPEQRLEQAGQMAAYQENIANDLRAAVALVNDGIEEAMAAGLQVDFNVLWRETLGKPPVPKIVFTVSKPL